MLDLGDQDLNPHSAMNLLGDLEPGTVSQSNLSQGDHEDEIVHPMSSTLNSLEERSDISVTSNILDCIRKEINA